MSRRSPDPNEPVDLDIEFNTAVKVTHEVPPPVPLPTGLSDEEDALRHLALRFNPNLLYCPNCETVEDTVPVIYGPWCRYCGDHLRDMGTSPRKKKLPQQ